MSISKCTILYSNNMVSISKCTVSVCVYMVFSSKYTMLIFIYTTLISKITNVVSKYTVFVSKCTIAIFFCATLILIYTIQFMNFKLLVCLNCGLVVPNTDLLYVLTSIAMNTKPEFSLYIISFLLILALLNEISSVIHLNSF